MTAPVLTLPASGDHTYTRAEVAEAMDALWRQMLEFPAARVCRHYAASLVIDRMERMGIETPNDVVRAVVFCEDDLALAWRRPAITPDH